MQPSCVIEVCPATPVAKEHQMSENISCDSADTNERTNDFGCPPGESNRTAESLNCPENPVNPYTEMKPSNSSLSISSVQRPKSPRIRSNSKSGATSFTFSKSAKFPSWRTHKYGKYCWKSWITFVHLVIAFRAIIVRIGFICFTCTAIVTVVREKEDNRFWFLALTILPLLIDLIIAINSYISGKSVAPTISKWFSLCNFTYLICACPPIWIIELHHMDQANNASALYELISAKNSTPAYSQPMWIDKIPMMSRENESMMIMGEEIEEYIHSVYLTTTMTTTTEPPRTRRTARDTSAHQIFHNKSGSTQISSDVLQSLKLHNFSLKERIRILEQLLLLSVIVGRWLMPREGLTRDQLSQLLLINIGTAADILELFEAFNEQEVRRNDFLRTVILSLWQASLLQFCFNKTALKQPHNYNNYKHWLNKSNDLVSSVPCSADEKSLSDIECGLTVDNSKSNSKNKQPRDSLLTNLKNWRWKRKQHGGQEEMHQCIIVSSESDPQIKPQASESQQQQPSAQYLTPPQPTSTDLPKSVSQNDIVRDDENTSCPLFGSCILLCRERPCLCCETELWAIGISLMLQDIPFLVLRITLIVYYNVKSYSNVFFTCKNTLLILLQVFRSIVILSEAS
ncbi:unnamed protein product [Trichobilharzia szidati]|nr:unnamed protein product [Trichobilharzia szidati]